MEICERFNSPFGVGEKVKNGVSILFLQFTLLQLLMHSLRSVKTLSAQPIQSIEIVRIANGVWVSARVPAPVYRLL